MIAPMLELQHIRKDFDGLRAVNDVSFDIAPGSLIGLIGPNGSGKSTLMSLIAGTLPLSGGKIRFDGHDITGQPSNKIFQRGLVRGYQDAALFFRMSVLDNALLPVKHQRGEHAWYAPWRRWWQHDEAHHAADAMQALKDVNLQTHSNHMASDLSGGQMKLLEIARCLMGTPRMMLLDEPTAGVAPALAYRIFEQIAAMRAQTGITFLIVEHRLEILFDFVDYVYVMHTGNLFAQGTPTEIANHAGVREVYFGD